MLQVQDLGRSSAGSSRALQEHVPAPKDFGVAMIGVQEGSDMDLDLTLEAVYEGILVSGSVLVPVTGECSRCLDPLAYDLEVDVQELFSYEEPSHDGAAAGEDEEEQHWIEHDMIDLEPVLRDAVVTALPFQPVCREDCQGLCSECGIHLADEPGHHHEVLDPRWAGLQGLTGKDSLTES
ncbi:YceD family protein [Paenarthrobacter sp. Z7-10]|uniref:YceD family protein n=1 Tax=Paenarthrobacter sp. Z7-10 TaxID=2787635 RepID=UPI003FA78182